MARGIHKLSAAKIAKLATPGRHGDGGGLYLQIAPGGTRSWLFRFMRDGKAREMGLGALATVTLAEARERARDARKALADGIDPIAARQARRGAERAEAARAITFRAAAGAYIEAHRPGWKNAKHGAQWESTLATYAYPTIGGLPVSEIDVALVLRCIEPIWTTKTETAGRVRGRIEAVLDWAAARGYRTGDNPARWRGHLETLLPARSAVAPPEPFAALPYAQAPAFMRDLRQRGGIGALALEFQILTASRPGAVFRALWDEIDLQAKVWTFAASRPGTKLYVRSRRVPLSRRAIEILEALPRVKGNPHVFPGNKRGQPISDGTMGKVIKAINKDRAHNDLPLYRDAVSGEPIVPHGFRSAFTDWVTEQTAFSHEVKEMALAHAIKDKVEAAYRRGDILEKRRRLMDAWAAYLAKPVAAGAAVVAMRRRGAA